MDLEQEVRRNAENIAAVTNTVTRLAAVQENAERQRGEDRDLMRKAVDGLGSLNEKMGQTLVMQENIKRLAESQGKLEGDIRAVRHDHQNSKQALLGLPILGEKIAANERKLAAADVRIDALEGRINALETWRDRMEGAGGAFKLVGSGLWAVFGAGILAIGAFIFKIFFQKTGG